MPTVTTGRPKVCNAPKTILLVDDDPVYSEIRSEFLTDANFIVIQASSPQEALVRLQLNPQIDLLLTDRKMSEDGYAGFSLAKAARAIKPGLPVILNSTDVVAPGKKAIYEKLLADAGGGIVIWKGENSSEFDRAINSLLENGPKR